TITRVANQVGGGKPACLRKIPSERSNRLQETRQPGIIGIQKSQQFTACLGDAPVTRSRNATIGLPYQANACVPQRSHLLRASISGPIINNYQFPVAECLRLYTGNTGEHQVLLVVQGHDDADLRSRSLVRFNRHRTIPSEAAPAGAAPYWQ